MIDTTKYIHYIETDSNGYLQLLDSVTATKRSYKLGSDGLYFITDEQRIRVE